LNVLLLPLLLSTLLLGDDEKTYELQLVSRAEKGQEEKIELEASVGRQTAEGYMTHSMKGKVKRTVKQVDGDGLASKEELTLEEGEFHRMVRYERGSRRSTRKLRQPLTQTVTREGEVRNAKGLTAPDGMTSDELMVALRQDPDAFARLVEPEEKVAKGEDWEVDPADVLVLVAPKRAKLKGKKSKAKATLEALKNGEATVKLEATLHFTTPDEPDDEQKVPVEVTLHAAIDGSKPPRHEKVVLTAKDAKGEKTVTTIELTRTRAEKDEDEDEKDEKKKTPAEKKKD